MSIAASDRSERQAVHPAASGIGRHRRRCDEELQQQALVHSGYTIVDACQSKDGLGLEQGESCGSWLVGGPDGQTGGRADRWTAGRTNGRVDKGADDCQWMDGWT